MMMPHSKETRLNFEADNKYNLTSWLRKIIAKIKQYYNSPAKFTNAKSSDFHPCFLGQKAIRRLYKTGKCKFNLCLVDVSRRCWATKYNHL